MCPPKLSGYLRYNARSINELPVPSLDLQISEDRNAHDRIVRLVEELRSARTLDSCEGDRAKLLVEFTKELNRLIFDLYGLASNAIEAIRGAV